MRQIHSIYCLKGSQVEIRNLSANFIWERFERGTVFVCMEMGRAKGNDHDQGDLFMSNNNLRGVVLRANKQMCMFIYFLPRSMLQLQYGSCFLMYKRMFKKAPNDKRRISSLACFSAPHVPFYVHSGAQSYAASTFLLLIRRLFEHVL